MRTGHSLTICLSLLPGGGGGPKEIKKKFLKKSKKKIKKKIKKKFGGEHHPLGPDPLDHTPPGPDPGPDPQTTHPPDHYPPRPDPPPRPEPLDQTPRD